MVMEFVKTSVSHPVFQMGAFDLLFYITTELPSNCPARERQLWKFLPLFLVELDKSFNGSIHQQKLAGIFLHLA